MLFRSKAYFKLESSGSPLLDAIALWKQMTGGEQGNRGRGQGGNQDADDILNQDPSQLSGDDLAKYRDALRRQRGRRRD